VFAGWKKRRHQHTDCIRAKKGGMERKKRPTRSCEESVKSHLIVRRCQSSSGGKRARWKKHAAEGVSPDLLSRIRHPAKGKTNARTGGKAAAVKRKKKV